MQEFGFDAPFSTRLQLSSDALLEWTHFYRGIVRSLVRFRQHASNVSGSHLRVVISELRLAPRGHYVLSDMASAATATAEQVLPRAVDPRDTTWYVHHGWFSSHDATGPETFTCVDLTWTDRQADPPAWEAMRRLPDNESYHLVGSLVLDPVEHVMRRNSWNLPPGWHDPIAYHPEE